MQVREEVGGQPFPCFTFWAAAPRPRPAPRLLRALMPKCFQIKWDFLLLQKRGKQSRWDAKTEGLTPLCSELCSRRGCPPRKRWTGSQGKGGGASLGMATETSPPRGKSRQGPRPAPSLTHSSPHPQTTRVLIAPWLLSPFLNSHLGDHSIFSEDQCLSPSLGA